MPQRRHAARPRLVVDNSRRIYQAPAQKVLWQGNVFFPGHSGNVTTEFPGHAVCLPFVHGLPVNGLPRPLGQPSGHHGSIPQGFDKVSMILHGYRIVREFLGFVNADNSDDPNGFRMDTRGMTNRDDKSPDAIAAGSRLTILRGALGYEVRREYAKFLASRTTEDWRTWEKRLEKYESGDTMLPISFVRILKRLHYVTYNWIFDNESAQLPNDLYVALENYQKRVG